MDQTEQVITICRSLVDYTSFEAPNMTLCLDGTSCTKKSSILQKTGGLVTKVQRYNPTTHPNTWFPAMIGYVCAGINGNYRFGPHFSDRSPLNPLEWYNQWLVFEYYVKLFGNVEPDYKNLQMKVVLNEFDEFFDDLKQTYFYKLYANHCNTMVIIDSNVERCDSLRMKRREGSDCERSHWKFYTSLQNKMYQRLYPQSCIDLAMFDSFEDDAVVSGIATFMNQTLQHIVQSRIHKPEPYIEIKLPVPDIQYLVGNYEIHTLRSIGRHGCTLLSGKEDSLEARIPSFLEVDNIWLPNNSRRGPIVPQPNIKLHN